jgi:phage portal protein BeeE
MGLFSRKITAPAAYVHEPDIKAAVGASQIGQFYSYSVGASEEAALSVPTIARAISLIGTVVGTLDLKAYTLQWTGDEYEKLWVPGETWFTRPDPTVPRQFIMAKTCRDLIMYGRAHWAITSRYSTGFPASFQWLPANMVASETMPSSPEWFGMPTDLEFNGIKLDVSNVITFLSPNQGIVYAGHRAIRTALTLDYAAERFASNEIAAGYLQQRGGEPMSGEELGELAAAWANARRTNAIGALNEFVEWKEYSGDPSKLQLVEGRKYAALEMARLLDIPGYLLGIDQSGMTYQNAQQSRQDLILFGARPMLHAIQERLSMDDVLPRGRHCQFGIEEYLEDFMVESPETYREPEVPDMPDMPDLPSDEMDLE